MNTAPSRAPDPTWPAYAQEARLLGATLRTSRLALLIGDTGSDKTAFLKMGLMPLLHRRTSDRDSPSLGESGVVVPFPDRRRRAHLRAAKRRELIIYFDDWTANPLAALRTFIHRVASTDPAEQAEPHLRLSEILADLCSRLDATFIILLDRFEEFLEDSSHREYIGQFADELVEAINHAALPANFLISLNEEAQPRLAGFRSRIPGFDDFSLKLARPQGPKTRLTELPALDLERPDMVAVATTPSSEPATLLQADCTSPALTVAATCESHAAIGAKRKKPKLRPPPQVRVGPEDVYAFIESTLAVIAPDVASEPFSAGQAQEAQERRTCAPEARTPDRQPEVSGSKAPSQIRGTTADSVVKWLGRLLHLRSRPGR
jgi:hypothetical protein